MKGCIANKDYYCKYYNINGYCELLENEHCIHQVEINCDLKAENDRNTKDILNQNYDIGYTQGYLDGIKALKDKLIEYMPYAYLTGGLRGNWKEGTLSEDSLNKISKEVMDSFWRK